MGVVGGNRHYVGGGLGSESGWACPSCGAENAGPIAGGCSNCGAGRPGARVEAPPPPPPPRPAQPQPEPQPEPQPQIRQGDVATYWAQTHPDVSIEEAYRAGYLDGVRAVRAAQQQAATQTEASPESDSKIARTIVAALEYFADQVLQGAPQEVASGEWCSVEEVRALVHQLQTTGAVHA